MTGDTSQAARRELVAALALGFAQFGSVSRTLGLKEDLPIADRSRVVAAGLVAGIGCELLQGIAVLADARCAYAAAALVRQLVEIEYLSWAVSEDPAEAVDWLQADRARRLARWGPGHIRGRAADRFPNSDYKAHCELGGHPVAETAPSILDDRRKWVELALYETCQHGSAAWHYLLNAFTEMGEPDEVHEAHANVDAAYGRWKKNDPLTRLKPNVGDEGN